MQERPLQKRAFFMRLPKKLPGTEWLRRRELNRNNGVFQGALF